MKFTPKNGLVLVHRLADESVERLVSKTLGQAALSGAIRSPGYYIARVLALPQDPPPDLEVGSKVLVEAHSTPDGAPLIPPDWFGLPQGELLALVFCRRLATPKGSEELAHRLKEVRAFTKAYPEAEFPQHHPLWETREGEALLVQAGEHRRAIMEIKNARRGKGFDRLFKKGDGDFTLPDGILAVLED